MVWAIWVGSMCDHFTCSSSFIQQKGQKRVPKNHLFSKCTEDYDCMPDNYPRDVVDNNIVAKATAVPSYTDGSYQYGIHW